MVKTIITELRRVGAADEVGASGGIWVSDEGTPKGIVRVGDEGYEFHARVSDVLAALKPLPDDAGYGETWNALSQVEEVHV